jgi:adenosylhomocysteine nucleosidase
MEHELKAAFSEPLIVSALPFEQAELRRRLGASLSGPVWSVRHRGRPVRGVVTGDGAIRAERGLRSAIKNASVVVVIGIGGGLDPKLDRGQRVAGATLRDATNPNFVARLARWPGAPSGTMVTAPAIVDRAAAKAALWRRMGEPERAVVDLETVAYARVAKERGCPLFVLRVVSDDASDDLPPVIAKSVDAEGSVRPARVAMSSLFRPHTWGALIRLTQHTRRAAAQLADATEALLETAARQSSASTG